MMADCRFADAPDVPDPDADGSPDPEYQKDPLENPQYRHVGINAANLARTLKNPDEVLTLLEFSPCGGIATPIWVSGLQDNRTAQSDLLGRRDPGLQTCLQRSMVQMASISEVNHLRWIILTTAGSATAFHNDSYGQVSCVMAYADGVKMVTIVRFGHTVFTPFRQVAAARERFKALADAGKLADAAGLCTFSTYFLRPGCTM
jgi:hypothetical protein